MTDLIVAVLAILGPGRSPTAESASIRVPLGGCHHPRCVAVDRSGRPQSPESTCFVGGNERSPKTHSATRESTRWSLSPLKPPSSSLTAATVFTATWMLTPRATGASSQPVPVGGRRAGCEEWATAREVDSSSHAGSRAGWELNPVTARLTRHARVAALRTFLARYWSERDCQSFMQDPPRRSLLGRIRRSINVGRR